MTCCGRTWWKLRFCRHLPERKQNFWELDLEHKKAILKNPPKPLKRVEVPFSPVLGCLGVAPERGEAITTYTCGNFGGNMDYYGMVEGMTIYLPVFVPGGLLFLGDGHAVQSQGEVTGAGLETSCEVTFEVGLVKNNPDPLAEGRKQYPSVHDRQCPAIGFGSPICHHRDAALVTGRLSALAGSCQCADEPKRGI